MNGWEDEEDRGPAPPIEEVVAKIRDVKPSMVCAPHVEASAGIILNKEYCKAIGDACKEVGATFCLDGVASARRGSTWTTPTLELTSRRRKKAGPGPAVAVCMMSE